MPANGQLFLGINDDHMADNSGGFRVQVDPSRSPVDLPIGGAFKAGVHETPALLFFRAPRTPHLADTSHPRTCTSHVTPPVPASV